MSAVVPSIHVYLKKNNGTVNNGMAGKIAVIGAFDSEETNPVIVKTIDEAYTKLGEDKTFNGVDVIPYLFVGAESLLCVNTTTWTGNDDNKTADKTIDVNKLTNALSKIKGENFDILFIAETLTDAFLPIITSFLDESFEMKMPSGFTGALTGNVTANIASAELAGEHCYGLITQSLKLQDEALTQLESIAYYTGLIAGMNVGNTFTMKSVDNITGVNPELTFEVNSDVVPEEPISDGAKLLSAGITTFKCLNRDENNYVVVNSEQPNGYDLYINRVRNYVVKEFALHKFLGDRNRQATLTEIEHELASVKERCVNDLDLLKDINYSVAKETVNCVGITIDSLVFDGIITRINMYVRVEVE